jgi:hypothetical protein
MHDGHVNFSAAGPGYVFPGFALVSRMMLLWSPWRKGYVYQPGISAGIGSYLTDKSLKINKLLSPCWQIPCHTF